MKALILVDLQNDFMPGGALPVANGREVVSVANRLIDKFDLIVATQDYHPANHKSFASQNGGVNVGDQFELGGLPQMAWPDHCVQGTNGADFDSDLDGKALKNVFRKGTDPEVDSYSGFFDNGKRKATGLGDFLKSKSVTEIFVMGLATEYCVKFTALDGAELGFKTNLIVDGCRGIELYRGDIDRAIEQMKTSGIETVRSKWI